MWTAIHMRESRVINEFTVFVAAHTLQQALFMAQCPVCNSERVPDGPCVVCHWSAASALCSTCGSAVGTDGTCSRCERERLVQLEIAAFTGPAIKRARLWMIVLGIFYVFCGILNAVQVADARPRIEQAQAAIAEARYARERQIEGMSGEERRRAHDFDAMVRELDPSVAWTEKVAAQVDTKANLAWISILLGAAALLVALWAKRRTMAACVAIGVVFGVHTLVSAVATSGAVFADPFWLVLWLVFLVIVILAFAAGRKAQAASRRQELALAL
jgi:hypothetical protein